MTGAEQWQRNLSRWRADPGRMQQFPAFELAGFHGWDISAWFEWWERLPRPLIQGRMIALKNDPLWDMIPADNDGIILVEIHHREAKQLGLDVSSLPKRK